MLPRVWKEWDITRLCYEADTEEYARERDYAIQQAAQEAGACSCRGERKRSPEQTHSQHSMCMHVMGREKVPAHRDR